MDDAYIWAPSTSTLQSLLDAFLLPLHRLGLTVNPDKTVLVASVDSLTGSTIHVEGKTVSAQPPTTPVDVLGTTQGFRIPASQDTQRAIRRAHQAFAAHKDARCTPHVPLKLRLAMFSKVVTGKALWCAATWHPAQYQLRLLNTAQLSLVRYITAPKRKPQEDWAQWNQRSLRHSRLLLSQNQQHRWSTLVLIRVYDLWMQLGAVAPPDITHSILHWRDLRWWEGEQSKLQGLRHPHRFNSSLDTERMFRAVATPRHWTDVATSPALRHRCRKTFLDKFDLPWASGSQPAITNLSPTPQSYTPTGTTEERSQTSLTLALTPTFPTSFPTPGDTPLS